MITTWSSNDAKLLSSMSNSVISEEHQDHFGEIVLTNDIAGVDIDTSNMPYLRDVATVLETPESEP
jgi:hypothetical protein